MIVKKALFENIFSSGGEMGELIKAFDWSKTPLGPINEWPQNLTTSISIMLASRFPIQILWGSEYIQFYNDAYRPILGSKHPKSLGQRGQECWSEVWDFAGPRLDQVRLTGEASWSDDQLLLLDRHGYLEECYFTFSYTPVRDEWGEVAGIFNAVNETTQRVIEERRKHTLETLSTHVAKAKTPDEACTIAASTLALNPADVPFALFYWLDNHNANLVSTVGFGDQLSPLPLLLKLDLNHPVAETEALVKAALSGEPFLIDHLQQKWEGLPTAPWGESPHSALVLPIFLPGQDHPLGVFVAGISPRRRLDNSYRQFFELIITHIALSIASAYAYQEERKRAEALAELDRAKTVFFSNISHELRTPLTLIQGPLEDILNQNTSPLSPRERSSLEMAQRNVLRLQKLVNTFLDFSRIEAGRIQAFYQPTDLATFTQDLASVFRSAIERAQMCLVVHCPPLPQLIYVDHQMWEKIVLNLLSNAFKFTFEGEIRVSLEWAGDHVKLAVQDTGIGIPAAEIPHLFERFHRIEGVRSRTHEGSGIGLCLVRELVHLHGGTIEVNSTENVGTCFTVYIPTGVSHLQKEKIGLACPFPSSSATTAVFVEDALGWLPDVKQEMATDTPEALRLSTPSARILLADDNRDMREYVQRLLSQHYDVETVPDGMAALEAIRHHPPDLVLTDVMMPQLNGFELLQQLRRNPLTRELPIILLSARAGEEYLVEGLEAGADDYLVKPFSARELLARIEANLKMAKIRRQAAQKEQQLREEAEKARLIAQERAQELTQLNLALTQTTELLQKRNEELDQFAYVVSHDLKAPLRAIHNLSEWIEEDLGELFSPENQQQMQLLRQRVYRLENLIDGLLKYSRVGRTEVTMERVNVAELLAEVIDSLAPPPSFTLDIDESMPTFTTQKLLLSQVFSNLIGNGIKHHNRGDGQLKIYVEDEKDSYHFFVEDDGEGIPPEAQEKIFLIFQTLSNQQTKDNTGIGLSIVKKIVEIQGGKIHLKSKMGEGSIFSFTWPKNFET